MYFLNIIVSIILVIEYIVRTIPTYVVIAIEPKFGLIIIIIPHITDKIAHINNSNQLLPLIFFKDKESLISKLDLVIMTIPIKIGNNVFTILGLISIIVPTSSSIIPKDKNPGKR